jgi:hypothetical protein
MTREEGVAKSTEDRAGRKIPTRYALVALLLVALLLSFLLPVGGPLGDIRVALCGGALLTVPGVLVIARADGEGDWILSIVGAVVVSMALYVLVAYAVVAVHVRLSQAVFVLAAVAVSCALLVGWRPGPSSRRSLTALGLTVLLAGGAVSAAIVTHLALPSTPVESSFSLSAPTATFAEGTVFSLLAPTATFAEGTVSIPVEVARVHFARPVSLTVYVGNMGVEHATISGSVTRVILTIPVPPSAGSCPRVSITSSNGSYLSPHLPCRT